MRASGRAECNFKKDRKPLGALNFFLGSVCLIRSIYMFTTCLKAERGGGGASKRAVPISDSLHR